MFEDKVPYHLEAFNSAGSTASPVEFFEPPSIVTTTDQSPFHPLSFSQGIGVTIGAICFVLVVVILAATLPAFCRRVGKDKYLGILTGDFTSEWQGIVSCS